MAMKSYWNELHKDATTFGRVSTSRVTKVTVVHWKPIASVDDIDQVSTYVVEGFIVLYRLGVGAAGLLPGESRVPHQFENFHIFSLFLALMVRIPPCNAKPQKFWINLER